MQKIAYRHQVKPFNSRAIGFFLRLILFACLGGVGVPVSWGRPPIQRQPAPSMPLDEIVSHISSLQNRIDSLTAVRTQMRQDSARTIAESAQRGSTLSKKAAEIDDALAKKKTMMAETRSRYEKIQQDSAAIVAKSKEQLANVHKEIAHLDATIVTMSSDLTAISGRREQAITPAGADERAISQLQAQVARYDSTIRTLQSDLANCTARRNKLRQDSLQAETRIANERSRFRMQMYPFDSLSALCDIAIRQAEQKLASDQAAKEQKINQIKENFILMARQKKGFDDRVARNNADINTFSAERQRLAQSSGAAQTRYEQLRGPYDRALTDAVNELQHLTRDKPLLKTLRHKLTVDSAIAKTRDGLDKAIQLAAENKKGGKKLVEQRDSELDSLQALQDLIVRSTPGLRQKEAQIHGVTISQKSMLTDDAIAAIDKKTAFATAQLDKARRELEAFDRKNPPVQNPSGQRIAQLDTLLALKKKEVIQMTDWSDSLNMLLQETQNTIAAFSGSARTGSPESDRVIKEKKDEKTALAGRRAKLQRDSIQNDAAAMEVIGRIRNDCAASAGQLVRTQSEKDRTVSERDKTMQSLSAAQEKNLRSNAAALAEKKKNDNLVASKQQDITSLSLQSEKLRQDSIAIVKQQEQQIKGLSPTMGSLANMLSDNGREINTLQAQSDSLKRLASAGQGRINDDTHKISLQINSVSRSIENTQNDIVTLNAQKKDAYTRLESDKRYYDSLIGTADHERDGMVAQHEKVRQDSITAENNLRNSLQKVMATLKEYDDTIAAKQKEVSAATAELNHARDDSVGIAVRKALPGNQTIGSIDSLIAVRGKELAGLQDRRDKAVQDSAQESKRLSDLLAAAHNEIVKRKIALEQRNNELSLSAEVKNEPAGVDPLQRSYRDALVTATTEIKTQNEIIRKKKNDMMRLRAVRDALTSATDTQNTDPSSRLDTDKRYYDSLLSIAAQELSAIVARRDIARQDSASADNNLQASLQKAAPAPAEHDNNSTGLQKEITAATAELNQARDDSTKIANAIPNTLQPYGQTIRTIDVLMGVKAKELTGFQDQREKAGQDGLRENKHNTELLAAAHAEIAKRSIALEQKRNELTLATAAKNSIANNTSDPEQRNYKQALDAAKLELNAQNELIENKKNEITRLQNVRDAINAKIRTRDNPSGASGTETRPAARTPRDSAQKCSEDIYVLVGENRIAEASSRFAQIQPFLKTNLDQETFQALKMTITEMGGDIK
jgi:chromosome segregation ATPase